MNDSVDVGFIDLVLKPEFKKCVLNSVNGDFDLTEFDSPRVINGLRHDFKDDSLNLLWLHWQHASKVTVNVTNAMFDFVQRTR